MHTVVTTSEESVLSTSEDRSRRFSRTSAEGPVSPFVGSPTTQGPSMTDREATPFLIPTVRAHMPSPSPVETEARYGECRDVARCAPSGSIKRQTGSVPLPRSHHHQVAIGDGLAAPPTMLRINPAAISPVEP